MEPFERAALVVRPKRRYKEWADSVADGDDDPVFDLDAARTTPAVYLVALHDESSLEDYIDEYAADIFELELEAWHGNEARWPVNRSPHVFRDWFDVTFAETVVDLDPREPLYYFDDDEGGVRDLLAALRGAPGATMGCAWCESEITPDEPVVTVNVKGPRTAHPEAELMHVSVGGRVIEGVIPTDDSKPGRAGVMVFFTFCGDECGNAFRDAWARERGALSS